MTWSEGAVTARRSTCLRLAERMGLRFSQLDPILMEPGALQRSDGWEGRVLDGVRGVPDDLLLSCSTESD